MDKELIEELYQSIIKEHSRYPRNVGTIIGCQHHKDGKNSSCGDALELYLDIDADNYISDIKFEGDGCALFMSSTSLMTQIIKGKNCEEAMKILTEFLDFIRLDDMVLSSEYEPLHIFETVKNFPSRIKCVFLPWKTLEHILNRSNLTIITTE